MDTDNLTHLEQTSHQHTRACWWDHRQIRWICEVSRPTGLSGSGERGPAARGSGEAVDAGDGVDVRDMIVVHTALLREFRLAPDAVQRVADGDRVRARRVDLHLALLGTLMHHHHAGEDALLWPVLGPRLSTPDLARLAVAESQHAGIEQALVSVDRARVAWVADPRPPSRDELSEALQRLHRLLTEHLEFEERNLLPLAALHLDEAEWRAIGEAGAAGVPKSALLLVLGMFAYEGDPEVLADMLHAAPAPLRLLVRRLAPRVYARHAVRIHGSRRP